jgi:uncharacterized lipoprotein YmbA
MQRALSILIGLCSLAAACSSSSPTRFFTLLPVPPAGAVTSYAGPPVKVADIQVPPSMDRLELVRQSAGNELVIDDFAHWAASLGDLSRAALTQDLAARLPGDRVVYPDVQAPEGTLLLSVDLLSFDCAPGTASLEASWTLTAKSKPAGPPRQLRLSGGCGADGPSEAAALSALLGQLADAVAADLARR